MLDQEELIVDMGTPTTTPNIIKVIGVGGGGGNAVNYMYNMGMKEINFVVCNTDAKALADSPVPVRLQLGTEGLGAGNRPARARIAAEESIEAIRAMLDDGTKMVFITAGMGGGTGTGAAPVIAHEAKKKGILTVGIVTIPFRFEGNKKIDQALDGVEAIAKEVDALLVINNERLREIYPDLTIRSAFERADNTLAVAARSIAEIITMHGIINLDFQDVGTVLRNGGVAIMSTGYGEGERRVTKAIEDALHSPLLNNNDIYYSKKILLSITFCDDSQGEDGVSSELMMEEVSEVHEFMSSFQDDVETKFGLNTDPTLGKKVKITILATGFGINSVTGMEEKLSAESEAEARAAVERQEERDERRLSFYGGKDKRGIQKRFHKIFLFEPEDTDNEEVIALVEAVPTSKRSKEYLNNIKNKTIPPIIPEINPHY
ncbi:cell division protein FtsZ [Alloprevotella sp. OH1205_COT-284]|uniref:cell division protein FtsZ n=1 Tax=Alloprevotella sp. OH1205_COT-284 TaxID=2491043 RepID=UPI000F5FB113|nr:cell division protein FtsZ [Alloprevotella sp. OH1205_COT-284]RRD77750.1 cell division protein FtsZ [Alloprevotella sp. OH1205_COT-284]